MTTNYLKNYYKILETTKEASLKEIKEAYRHLALKYHPDKCKEEDKGKFIDIAEAYEVLKNEDTRQDYDENHNDPSALMFIDVLFRNISLDEIQKYLDAGAFIDVRNLYNQTILMYAANRGYIELVNFLIKHGASVNAVDIYGNDPLIFAADIQMNFILEGFNINKKKPKQQNNQKEDPINPEPESKPEPASKPEPEIKESQKESAKPAEVNIDGSKDKKDDLLERKAAIAKALLDKGAQAKHTNNYGEHAIDHAASNKNSKMFELLQEPPKQEILKISDIVDNPTLEVEVFSNQQNKLPGSDSDWFSWLKIDWPLNFF